MEYEARFIYCRRRRPLERIIAATVLETVQEVGNMGPFILTRRWRIFQGSRPIIVAYMFPGRRDALAQGWVALKCVNVGLSNMLDSEL